MPKPFPALLQALNDRRIHHVDAATLYERYGYELALAARLDSDDKQKGLAFVLALQNVVLHDGACDRQWRDLVDIMVELQPKFFDDAELNQLHLALLSFPVYLRHYRRHIPGQLQRLPSGVYIEH